MSSVLIKTTLPIFQKAFAKRNSSLDFGEQRFSESRILNYLVTRPANGNQSFRMQMVLASEVVE